MSSYNISRRKWRIDQVKEFVRETNSCSNVLIIEDYGIIMKQLRN